MKYLDLTLPTPAENLACDEALLDWCEEGRDADEVLRVWEPSDYFVVVGYANQVATEAKVSACKAKGIPIYRRCTGGGTVLQGPGCLNYALVLRIVEHGPLHTVSAANRYVMGRNRVAVESALTQGANPSPVLADRITLSPSNPERDEVRGAESKIAVRGHTDLAVHSLKVSGNSQRRRRQFLLFHGTFLLSFDLSLIEELLPLPTTQPSYRQNRAHSDFLANLNLRARDLKIALQRTWKAASPLRGPPRQAMALLAREKYTSADWNFRF